MITINFYLNNKKELNDFVDHLHVMYAGDYDESDIVVDDNKIVVIFTNCDERDFGMFEKENALFCKQIEIAKEFEEEVEVLEFVNPINDEIENIEYSNEIIEIVDEVEVKVKEKEGKDWYWLLIKDWFYFKANKQFSNRMIAAWPDYDPNDFTRNIKEDMHEVEGACLKLAETEKAIKFRVPTEYFSGSCGRDWDMWFPKSVVKYGQNL